MSKNYSRIQDFLSLEDEEYDLEEIINAKFEIENDRITILDKIYMFINYFMPFKSIVPLMETLYSCVITTLNNDSLTVKEFDDMLVKHTVLQFIYEYISYAKIGQKEQVLHLLADSFNRLGMQPLALNLGLLVKPMYTDSKYLSSHKEIQESLEEFKESESYQEFEAKLVKTDDIGVLIDNLMKSYTDWEEGKLGKKI